MFCCIWLPVVLYRYTFIGLQFSFACQQFSSNSLCCNPDAAHFLFISGAISGLISSDYYIQMPIPLAARSEA